MDFTTARALFDVAKQPEVQRGVISAAKNPTIRSAAISLAKNEQVIAFSIPFFFFFTYFFVNCNQYIELR